ncbi:MAG TPA: LTA synthase family protein, partial [Clostridia bacterium]|nr:LTA synthase family protein [Clostridia bacterium]
MNHISNPSMTQSHFPKGIDKLLQMGQRLFSFVYSYNLWFYVLVAIQLKSVLLLSLVYGSSNLDPSLTNALKNIVSFPMFISVTAFFISIFFFFKGKVHAWSLFIFHIVFSIVLMGDAMYFRGFRSFLSFSLINQASNAEGMGDAVLAMFRWYDIFYIIDIPVIAALMVLKRGHFKRINRRRCKVALAVVLISLLYIGYYGTRYTLIEHNRNKVFFWNVKRPELTMSCISPLGYHLQDGVFQATMSKRINLSNNYITKVKNWYKQKQELLPDNEYKGIFKGKNLLVIQVESLEGFVINYRVGGQELTPNLNRILQNSLYFPNFSEQVHMGISSDAELLANASVYPIRWLSTFARYPNTEYVSLPKLLKKRGYSSFSAHPELGSCWNIAEGLLGVGFDKFYDRTSFKDTQDFKERLSDGAFFPQVLKHIEKQPQPFYVEIATLTTHVPYSLPKKYRKLELSSRLKRTVVGNYMQCLHYSDEQLKKFFNQLDKKGLLDNTVVVMYGDHMTLQRYYP